MMGEYGWGPGYGMGFGFGWVFMILFWVLLIAAIAAVVKWVFTSTAAPSHPLPPPARKNALNILEERYAKGEIDREEFLERKRDLEG